MPIAKTLLVSLALTACAETPAPALRTPSSDSASNALPAARAASRIGPPSARGLGLRRVDRASGAEPPIALR